MFIKTDGVHIFKIYNGFTIANFRVIGLKLLWFLEYCKNRNERGKVRNKRGKKWYKKGALLRPLKMRILVVKW